MRLLLASNLYPPHFLGGYELLCREAAEHFAARGHEVAVLASTHGVAGPMEEDMGGVRVLRTMRLEVPFEQPYAFNPMRRLETARWNAARMRDALRAWRPQVVHAWSQLRLTTAPMQAAADHGVPIAWSFNDANILAYRDRPSSGSIASGARRFLCRHVLPGSSLDGLPFEHSTVISECLREDLLAGGLPAEQARLIHQGIHLEDYPLRGGAGTIASPLRLCYAGQVHEYKGVHTAVEAAAHFARRHGRDSIALTVAGTGPEDYAARLRGMAEDAGLAVEFLGRVPPGGMSDVYRRHDAFVFPSTWREPFGLTHLEAMASGLVVASTANGGQGEFLEDGVNALVFEPGDAAGLLQALERIHSDPPLVASLVRAARLTVEQRFDIRRYLDELEQFVASAADAAP